MLVGLKTVAARFVPVGSEVYQWFEFIGHPFTAILVACLVAIYGLAFRQGMAKDKVMEICGHALQPAGIILRSSVPVACSNRCWWTRRWPGVGRSVNRDGPAYRAHLLHPGGAVRIIQGSATVAFNRGWPVTPVIEQLHYNGAQLAALSICIGGAQSW
ncbi:hypothetical protein ACNKHO_21690 [Shigella flexneri]